MKTESVRILLVDDHQILRDGLKVLLESEEDLKVVGEASTGIEGVTLTRSLLPDLAVVDLSLPDISGLEVIRQIREINPSCRIVVLSMHTKRDFVVEAIEAGCDGYVPKSSAHTSLLQAIHVVLSGERYLHPKAATALVDSLTGSQTAAEQFAELSEREQEVLRLSAMGYTSREIAEKLFISSKTVETYRQRAMEKLELEHRSDLIRFALRAGLLEGLKKTSE
jgi:two-component system, NarL family, response regulator NreC